MPCSRPLQLASTSAHADDCALIRKATLASQQAPSGVRHYLAAAGRPERLLSISKGAWVYISLGPGRWRKLPRAEVEDAGLEGGALQISQCRSAGVDTVDGVATTVYDYVWQMPGDKASPNRIWIDPDGLVRKQGLPQRGMMRYEYTHVEAPL